MLLIASTGTRDSNSVCVRIAQYMAIIIALLMEAEIPTGLYLLRRISKPYLKRVFPEISYSRFVLSNVLRILMGYLFLVNVVIILIQANEVLAIFYDVLALQFIQDLDDIAFELSKMRVLGRRMQAATMAGYFEEEFEKQRDGLSLKWKMKFALKAIYFFNLAAFLGAMITVSTMQLGGKFHAQSVTLNFGDETWPKAIIKNLGGQNIRVPLVYAFFNGVYDIEGYYNGRPMYVERNKLDHAKYDVENGPPIPEEWANIATSEQMIVKPAVIKHCEIGGKQYWVFDHDLIQKSSASDQSNSTECKWLARTEMYNDFDLLEPDRTWEVWTGAVQEATVSVTNNKCEDDSECNLNGECIDDKCECFEGAGVQFFGLDCGVTLEDKCHDLTHGTPRRLIVLSNR